MELILNEDEENLFNLKSVKKRILLSTFNSIQKWPFQI